MEGKYKQVVEVLNLFEKSDFTVMLCEFDGVKLSIDKSGGTPAELIWESRPAQAQPLPANPKPETPPVAEVVAKAAPVLQPAASAPSQPAPAETDGLHVVRAQMLGTFYRSPSPGEPPFAREGERISADDTLCLIECMKLFNTLSAGVSGRLVSFAVENGAMVEFDQPLAYIQPE